MQVTITTPTSSATGYYLLPCDDASKATLTLELDEVASISQCLLLTFLLHSFYIVLYSWTTCTLSLTQVGVKQEFTVTWTVPRASEKDRIG